jgi:hypothetical protein
MSKRGLLAINVAFRVGYGIGGLVAPSTMAKLRLAPDVSDRPDARLFVRGFSAHQIGVAALGLAGMRWRRLQRPAAMAAIAIDAADMLSAAVEARDRGELNEDLTGGAVFSAAGLVTAWIALSAIERQPTGGSR